MRLVDKYRPKHLDHLIGQESAAAALSAFAASPDSRAFLLLGTSGVGKTCASEIIARTLLELDPDSSKHAIRDHLNCHFVDSCDFRVDRVREIVSGMRFGTWNCGWRVIVIEEADLSSSAAQNAFLSVLDHLPEKTLIIFTSNEFAWWKHPDQFRLKSRMTTIEFEGRSDRLIDPARAFLRSVWVNETGLPADTCPIDPTDHLRQGAPTVSIRALLQDLDGHVARLRPDDRPSFALENRPAPERTLFSPALELESWIEPIDDMPESNESEEFAPCCVADDSADEFHSADVESALSLINSIPDVPASRLEESEHKARRIRALLTDLARQGRAQTISTAIIAEVCGVSQEFAGKIRKTWPRVER